MLYRRIEIVGYRDEDSPEPLFDKTKECHVYLFLSVTPPVAWMDMFWGLLRSAGSREEEPIGNRVKPSSERVIQLTTKGDFIKEDIKLLRQIVVSVNADFERVHKADLESQEQIATFLKEEFPPPGGEAVRGPLQRREELED